jgi:hypothetical protein
MTISQEINNKLDAVNTGLANLVRLIDAFQHDLDELKLTQARQTGQLDMLWKIGALAISIALSALGISITAVVLALTK